MNRFFGTAKPKVPRPTVNDAIRATDTRVEGLDVKIRKLDADLMKYKERIGSLREGAAKNAAKQSALQILKQKRLLETQRDQLMRQSFNMEQASMATENLSNTLVTVDAMKLANTEMKRQYKKINLDKIERTQDEMEDLLEQANEIQETMGRAYGLPDGIDEDDLEAELEALGDELLEDSSEPSYLQDTNFSDALPTAGTGELAEQKEDVANPSAPLKA